MRKSNDIFITNTNSIKIKSTNDSSEISNRMNKVTFKENQIYEREKITENLFEYLIKENTAVANFEKVTDYYEQKVNRNKIIYDKNLAIIKSKKEEIKNIKKNILDIIMDNIVFDHDDLDLYYGTIIEKLKKEIILMAHELESYKNTYSETYKTNYILNSKLENISKTEIIYAQQLKKYINIKEVALSKLKKQEEMLKTLNYYFEKIKATNQNLLDEKQKKLKQLNFEIHVIKAEEEKNEKDTKIIKEKYHELNNFFQKKREENIICKKDIKSYMSNYYKDKVIVNKIYATTREKNMNYIINKYNKLRFKNMNYSTLFSIKSKNLIDLNSSLSSLNNEYKLIKRKIENKEKEEVKNNMMNNDEYIGKIIILKEKTKSSIKEKNKSFLHNFKLLINIINSTLKLITDINHSRQISVSAFEGVPYINNIKRDDLIQKYKNYFDTNFSNKNKINFEDDFANKKFMKFLIFIIKELNFQIKSIISNVYQILYKNIKEKKLSLENSFIDYDTYKRSRKYSKRSSVQNSEKKEDFISGFNLNEYQKIFEYELELKKKQIEERKKFFQFEEKELFKKKQNINSNKGNQLEENTNVSSSKSNMFSSLTKERSSDYISTSDFLQQYYKYYSKSISENENMNYSTNINLNKFKFTINYTNEFVSNRKEFEDKKIEKYKSILIKSKKIKEENEKKELFKYLKKSAKIKKLLKEQYSQDISSDSENEEKHKKEELAMQMIAKRLAQLKKPKKFTLNYPDKEVSKIYERYDDIRSLELNFIKNKGNLFDSGFFSEYYFRLKKQFKENQAKSVSKSLRIQMPKKIPSLKYQNSSKTKRDISNYDSMISERKNYSVRYHYNFNKKNLLKKINKSGRSLFRNNSEILKINLMNNK